MYQYNIYIRKNYTEKKLFIETFLNENNAIDAKFVILKTLEALEKAGSYEVTVEVVKGE